MTSAAGTIRAQTHERAQLAKANSDTTTERHHRGGEHGLPKGIPEHEHLAAAHMLERFVGAAEAGGGRTGALTMESGLLTPRSRGEFEHRADWHRSHVPPTPTPPQQEAKRRNNTHFTANGFGNFVPED